MENFTDATCDRCNREWAGDYPVCMFCATEVHFPNRPDCIHCDIAREIGTTVDAATLRKMREWLLVELAGPTRWAMTNPLTELDRFAKLHNVDIK